MSDLKKCPVCGSSCFSDMDVCYGCLHRFGGDEARIEVGPEPFSEVSPGAFSSCVQGDQAYRPVNENLNEGSSAGAVQEARLADCLFGKEKAPSCDEGCACKLVERKDCDFAQIEITVRIPKDMSSLMGQSAA